jgi:hypothetical protein
MERGAHGVSKKTPRDRDPRDVESDFLRGCKHQSLHLDALPGSPVLSYHLPVLLIEFFRVLTTCA